MTASPKKAITPRAPATAPPLSDEAAVPLNTWQVISADGSRRQCKPLAEGIPSLPESAVAETATAPLGCAARRGRGAGDSRPAKPPRRAGTTDPPALTALCGAKTSGVATVGGDSARSPLDMPTASAQLGDILRGDQAIGQATPSPTLPFLGRSGAGRSVPAICTAPSSAGAAALSTGGAGKAIQPTNARSQSPAKTSAPTLGAPANSGKAPPIRPAGGESGSRSVPNESMAREWSHVVAAWPHLSRSSQIAILRIIEQSSRRS